MVNPRAMPVSSSLATFTLAWNWGPVGHYRSPHIAENDLYRRLRRTWIFDIRLHCTLDSLNHLFQFLNAVPHGPSPLNANSIRFVGRESSCLAHGEILGSKYRPPERIVQQGTVANRHPPRSTT